MEHPDTLYPYELLSLLEALHEEGFGGQIVLHAEEGRTLLYLTGGQVRYATTTGVAGSFPAYLITEEVFPRERVRLWLETCTDEELSMEEMLLRGRRMDADGLVRLKADLADMVFARAFTATATVEIEPFAEGVPNFGDVVLDPYRALFQSVAEDPMQGPMLDHLQGYWKRPIRRGPAFFVLLPEYRHWFGRTRLPALIDDAPSLADLAGGGGEVETLVAQLFAMCMSGMAYFQGERPKTHIARGLRRRPEERDSAVGVPPPPAPNHAFSPARSAEEMPSARGVQAVAEDDPWASLAAIDGDEVTQVAPLDVERSVAPRSAAPPPPPPQQSVFAESEAMSFADLRGSLVGEGLVEAARVAAERDEYEFLGVRPDAPFSDIRAAYRLGLKRYDDAQYDGYFLPGPADRSLRYLQRRVETAYETLIDLRQRAQHDHERQVDGRLPRERLEQMFYAEGVFKAAQIRMAKGLNAAAMELLEEALEHCADEPEYTSYLAWAVYSAAAAGQPLPIGTATPQYLLDEALGKSPKLESAWLFRARIADHSGDAPGALAAYHSVLTSNPDNEEARVAIQTYLDAGVVASADARPTLADRLARILRR